VRERLLFCIAALFVVAPPLLVQVAGLRSPHLRGWRMFSSAGFEAYRVEVFALRDGARRRVEARALLEPGATACVDELRYESWCSAHPATVLYVRLQCGQPAARWRLVYDGKQDLCSPPR
jgi:hypothetical protein